MYKQDTTSIAERNDMPKKRLNSGLVCPVLPSAIFNTTEFAALLICGPRLNISALGNDFNIVSIRLIIEMLSAKSVIL